MVKKMEFLQLVSDGIPSGLFPQPINAKIGVFDGVGNKIM